MTVRVTKAEVDQLPGNGEIILNWPDIGQGVGYAKSHKAKQRRENSFLVEVVTNGADPVSGAAVCKRLRWGIRLF
jgi:hypothetical protein